MRLIKCYVSGFGILQDVEYIFERGLNSFVLDNGKGKTTLTAFIRAMLFGLCDSRKQSLEENPRKMYAPWSGNAFGGSLTVEIDKQTYTIERSFGARASEDIFTLRDSVTGMVSDDYSTKIGEEIFGIDEEGFSKTVLLGEGASYANRHNPSVASRLSDAMGSDGDVGDYDAAIKRLDEARRFYHKRGGSGEIGELSARIQECKLALDEIERQRERATEIENELVRLDTLRGQLHADRTTLEDRLVELGKEKERMAWEKVYRSMLDNLEIEKTLLRNKRAAFGDIVPTSEDIDNAREDYQQAIRLRKEVEATSGGEDFVRLSKLFAQRTDFEELEKAKICANNLESYKKDLLNMEENLDEATVKMSELFPIKVPTMKDIDEHIRLCTSSSIGFWILPLIFGVLIAILGVVTGILVSAGMYAFVGTGVALVFLGISLHSSKKKNRMDRIKRFLLSIGADTDTAFTETLECKKRDLVEYERLDTERKQKHLLLKERIEKCEEMLGDFLSRFPIYDEKTIGEHIKYLSVEYGKFYAMNLSSVGEESNEEKLKRAEKLINNVRIFVSRYGITEGDPFIALKTMLEQYTFLRATVQRLEKECEEYRTLHGLTGDIPTDISDDLTAESIKRIDSELAKIESEYAVNNRIYRELLDRLGEKNEIEAKYIALCEKKAQYEHNLALIKRTMEILTEARDRMTSKYLGKTRERFIYYENAISEGHGEFSVSNNFTLTINDKGKGRSEQSYSRGVRDLYNLAMQVALSDAMYQGEPPFLILDDPFISFDDQRCKRGMALIKKLAEERQILYFTCSQSRAIK